MLERSGIALLALAVLGCSSEEIINPVPVPVPVVRPAPSADVSLVVDALGITHVYARSDADAFFGAGYAMARDRLFDMELNRRQAQGRSSEIFGSGSLSSDIASRAMNFARLGEADETRVRAERPDDAALADAWTAGVNMRIAEIEAGEAARPLAFSESELGFLPEPWTTAHAFAVGKLLAFGLSNSLEPEILATVLRRLVPDTVEALPLLMPAFDAFATKSHHVFGAPPPPKPAPSGKRPRWRDKNAVPQPPWFRKKRLFPAMGSNNWAVSGRHTSDGRPLLAGDPHQSLTSPTTLWPFHMNSMDAGGAFDVIGFGFPGTPSVELGHNRFVGWTATVNYADVMDIWDVRVDDAFENIELGGKQRKLVPRDEKVLVRQDGAAFGENDETALTVYECPGFGVLLPEEALPVPVAFIADGQLLFNWTGFEPSNEGASYVGIDRSTDLDTFDAAVDLLEVGAVNFVAADAKGIGYRVHARVPDRGDPSSRPMPWHSIPGHDAESLWTRRGDLPKAKLPHVRDPDIGYLVTANNDPFGFTADGNVENDAYYYGSFFDKGFRAHRITQALDTLIANKPKALTRADMEELQRDVRSSMADALMAPLAIAIANVEGDPTLAAYKGRPDLVELANRLGAWDKRFDKTQGAPVVFLGLEWFALKRVLEEPLTSLLFDTVTAQSPPFFLGALHNIVEGRVPRSADFLPEGGVSELLLASLDDTSHWLVERFGSIDANFTLADIHGAEFSSRYGEALAVPRAVVSGSADTVNVSEAAFFSDGAPLQQFTSHVGPLYRMVIGFGADGMPEATVDFARGTREDPADPHYGDQQKLWLQAGHTKLPFRKADVDASTTDVLVLHAR